MSKVENGNANFEEEVDEVLDSLFKSTINIDLLKEQNERPKINEMTSRDFTLDKELSQSKINININEIDDFNKYLKKRVWDSSDDNKIQDIEKKVEMIHKKLDSAKINDLISQIHKCKIENFYKNFRPKCNDKPVGSLSSLDFLIEITYNSHPSHYDIMILDRKELSPYIYKFRSVLGDGDCFYRGFIFSFLENIIFTNNIMLMKELLILFYEKINLENKLIKEKEYLLIFHQMNIDIVSRTLYIIIMQMENDIQQAYRTLLKLFLYCPDFDFGIIYFMRYLIYEYILENENKIYSREFQVEIGCLLPEDYVIDKGNRNEYLFEKYFSMQLMKTKTFAEKIALYIAPFVFNVNMNILIYDFGINGAASSIQEKKFLCDSEINSQMQINLIFRKAHYDIFYKKKYYEDYKNYFNILRNIKEDIQIINKTEEEIKQMIEEKEKQKQLDDEIIDLIDDDYNDDKNKDNNQQASNINKNYYNKDNISICLECKKPQENYLNDFFLCNDCLLNNVKTALLTSYMEFIQIKSNMINSNKKKEQLLDTTYINSEVQGKISIRKALYNTKYKIEDIFFDIRTKLCVHCGESLKNENDYFIILPCKCRICKQQCFFEYVYLLKKILIKEGEDISYTYVKYVYSLSCFCGFQYHTFDILNMIQELDKRKLKDQKEMYQNYLNKFWNWKCMICYKNFRTRENFYRLFFDTDKIDKKLLKSKKDLKHLLCEECKDNINKNETVFCAICEFEHKIDKIKEVDENNDEDSCSIF